MLKHVLASSFSLLSALAAAQSSPQQITVTGRMIGAPLQVGGFGDTALARSPFAASQLTETQLQDAGARSLSDLTRFDAAISDAYNAEGYWQSLTVRGFPLDNRFNYRRDGLPINAETVIPLDDKAGLELLKGTSGIQAGTSAPGGLVNFVVKRPTKDLRSALVEWREPGSLRAAADISQRFGVDQAFGVRVNASVDHLDPPVRQDRGHANLFAIAGDWRLSADTLIEAEAESNHQAQPSVPAFSLLGGRLPSAREIDPRINLNDQPWSLPVVFEGDTASLRITQHISGNWSLRVHGMEQRLLTQDRVAFPFGCSAEGDFTHYCSDGTFDLYDYRSENERRRSDALDTSVAGTLGTGPVEHKLHAGVLLTRFRNELHRYAYNYAGTGNIEGTLVVPPSPAAQSENTNRNEHTTELYVQDAMQLSQRWSLWAGVRHTQLHREAVLTDGTEPTSYGQQFTTPWIALAHQLTQQTMLYASWGEGVESDVAPNLPMYTNAGQALPAAKSRQYELGLKHNGEQVQASTALFDIDRPHGSDIGRCDPNLLTPTCTHQLDGSDHHRGAEALVSWRSGPWRLHGSGMWLQARRRGAQDPSINGLRPTNVAARTARLVAEHDLAALPGLSMFAGVVYEGDRMVLPDNSVSIPAWTRLDLGARYEQHAGTTQLVWRVGVDNATDRRAWKEAPYQYGHAYLFPMAPRTWRVSLQIDI
jgi:iron complex outermembrane receptor protein